MWPVDTDLKKATQSTGPAKPGSGHLLGLPRVPPPVTRPQLAEYPTLQGFTLTCRANGFKELGKGQRVWEGAGEEDTDRERKPARWPGPEDSARLPQGHGGQ